MKLGVLLSGGKDSLYAAYLARESGFELTCLITLVSKNPNSFMFHTPAIEKTIKQSEALNLPLILQKTPGKKEKELKDLEIAIKKAIKDYGIEGVVTGAIESVYQSSRIQKICKKLRIKCFNPLWQKDQKEYLKELVRNRFNVIITAVGAYPLDDSWLGKKIDKNFIKQISFLSEKYKIHVAGEGGEFETFVLHCPLFSHALKIKDTQKFGEKNSWRMEVEVE